MDELGDVDHAFLPESTPKHQSPNPGGEKYTVYSQVFSVAVTCPICPAVAMTAHVQIYQSTSGSRVMKKKSAEIATSAQWQVVAVVSTAPPHGAINTRKAISTQEGAFHP